MDVGMNLPVMAPGLDRPLLLEWARRIDAGPFSTLAAGERVNFPNPDVIVREGPTRGATLEALLEGGVILGDRRPVNVGVILGAGRPLFRAELVVALPFTVGARR